MHSFLKIMNKTNTLRIYFKSYSLITNNIAFSSYRQIFLVMTTYKIIISIKRTYNSITLAV